MTCCLVIRCLAPVETSDQSGLPLLVMKPHKVWWEMARKRLIIPCGALVPKLTHSSIKIKIKSLNLLCTRPTYRGDIKHGWGELRHSTQPVWMLNAIKHGFDRNRKWCQCCDCIFKLYIHGDTFDFLQYTFTAARQTGWVVFLLVLQ